MSALDRMSAAAETAGAPAPAAPVVLRPEQVPDDLICAVCLTLPIEPLVTPCEHIFCRECITQALDRASQCPVDRTDCHWYQLSSPQGFVLRLWSNIQVKCGHHEKGCAWTGSLGDYAAHANGCDRGHSSDSGDTSALRDRIEALERENINLKNDLSLANQAKRELQQENARMQRELAEQRRVMTNQINEVVRETVHETFHGTGMVDDNYNYTRHHVVELTQLIARHLEDKPPNVDGNRIYNCVQACVRDLENNYDDNPQHFRIDMKMLLATCQATSTWFSRRQLDNFEKWYREQY